MRRILRILRKGIKTACLAAVLATCWQVGQPAQVSAATVTLQISGTVSPTMNDLSHVFLIYGTGHSSFPLYFGTVKLGDFSAGYTTPFTVLATAVDQDTLYWCAVGLYGDISSGQYNEGFNGVTLGIETFEGDSWEYRFPSLDEETVFNYLISDAAGLIPSDSWSWNSTYQASLWITDSSPLNDYSQPSSNGEIYIATEIVPEPITFLLLGAGGIYILRCRRDED
jgi:hypothetical protein